MLLQTRLGIRNSPDWRRLRDQLNGRRRRIPRTQNCQFESLNTAVNVNFGDDGLNGRGDGGGGGGGGGDGGGGGVGGYEADDAA